MPGDLTDRSAGDARRWLEERRAEFQQQRAAWAARESRRSWARLGVFLGGVALCVVVASSPMLVGGVAVLAVMLFIFAVRRHQHALAQREMADRLLLTVDEALQRCGGHVTCIRAWQRPPDNGDEERALPRLLEQGPIWSLTDQDRDDLDLFAAPVGIFGLLNRTSTAIGARRLRDMLESPLLQAERILARQATVRWLANNGRERLHVMAAMGAARREDERLARLIQAVAAARPLKLPVPLWSLRVWSVASAAFTMFSIAQVAVGEFRWGWWLLLLLAVNGALVSRIRTGVRACLHPWQDVAWAVRAYLIAARQVARDLPRETDLARLRECCAAVVAPTVLPRLFRRVGWTEHGGLAQALVNLVAFVDVHVARGLAKCVVPHRAALLAGLSALAELDALCSLGSFAFEQRVTCYPTPSGQTEVSIVGGYHPLIAPERVVLNDLHLTPTVRMWVISGSNMAGKTTFLRMAGTNVLLAQVGCPAAARELRWSPLRLISDLRARDSLAKDESYFLAEVRHLRRMVLPPPGDTAIMGLIDEPFRGTNAQDQSAASIAVIRRLLTSGNLFLLATHDRNLTVLADGECARNYHFRENLSSDGMVFGYVLHEGPAPTRNALRILEREGYPPELVRQAYAWLGEQPPDRS